MSPIYADRPFSLLPTPNFSKLNKSEKPNLFSDCASEIALVHNIMIRALNAIYLQAPSISPSDTKSFCQFILHLHSLLSIHHSGEEAEFFPDPEARAGEKGIMSPNVHQHHAFHDGITAFHAYISACAAGKDVYDGDKVVRLIDGFGTTVDKASGG